MSRISLTLVIFLAAVAIDRSTLADFTQTIPATGREFIVHVPPSYDGSTPVPLLFMFHGLGSNSSEAASSYYDWSSLADSENFIALYPDSLSFGDGKHWDIQGSGISQDLDFVSDMIDWATTNYNIRNSQIFTTGHSYGAFFSYYTAYHLSDQIAAFGEHSGGALFPGLPSPPVGEPKLNGFLLHSPDDAIVPYFLSSTLHTLMQNNGHTSVLVDLDNSDGSLGAEAHGWDKDYNDDQWQFFLDSAPFCDGIVGDANCDGFVDVSGDILTGFSNFTGPGSFGKTRAEGDVQGDALGATADLDPHDGDVDVTDLLTMFGNFTGPAPDVAGLAAAAAGDPAIPDLIYDPATGEVVLDVDGGSIIGYSLKSAGAFLAGGHTPILGGVSTSLSTELAEAALSSPAGQNSIGFVLPTGLDLAGLTALLTDNTVSTGLGAPLVPFDLVVLGPAVPEPSTYAMATAGLVGLIILGRRRQQRRRIST